MRLILTLAALSVAATGASPEAIFKSAIEDFEFGEHAQAAEKLRSILEPPRLESREDLIVARQYLGACYHLLDDRTKAKSQFSMLLALDPRHKLDPEVFSPALVAFFEEVRRETGLQLEREPEKRREEPPPIEEKRAPEEKPAPPPALPAREAPPAALGLIPFGVGQFANDHPVRGTIFAVSEVGLFAAAATTYLMLDGLKMADERCPDSGLCVAPEDQDRAKTLQTAALATFWTGVGVAVLGVVEALISYPGDALEP